MSEGPSRCDRDGAYRLTHADNPLCRPAEPDEVASVVCCLAGARCRLRERRTQPVDGGTSVVDPTAAGQFSP